MRQLSEGENTSTIGYLFKEIHLARCLREEAFVMSTIPVQPSLCGPVALVLPSEQQPNDDT